MNCRPLTIFLIFTYSIYVLLKSNGVATLPIRYRLGNCPTVKLKWSPSFDDVTKMYSIFFPLGKGCIAILWVTHTNITICIASFFQHSFCNVCSVNDKVNANHMSKKLCPHFFSLILFVLFLHLFSIFSRSCFFLYLSIYVPFMWCIDRVVRLMGQSYTHTQHLLSIFQQRYYQKWHRFLMCTPFYNLWWFVTSSTYSWAKQRKLIFLGHTSFTTIQWRSFLWW